MENSNKLPKLAELHHDVNEAFKNDQLNLLLNQAPHDRWIKQHPLAKVKNDQGFEVPSRYIPIDKIEFLLTRIFQHWQVEVKSVGIMFQSVYCVVRLWVKDPLTGEWRYHDGVGSKSVQVDKGQSAANLGAIKDAAVMMALPSAKSFAIKDAAEHFGALFGRDLNRRETVMFSGSYEPSDEPEAKRERIPYAKNPPSENKPEQPIQTPTATTSSNLNDFEL